MTMGLLTNWLMILDISIRYDYFVFLLFIVIAIAYQLTYIVKCCFTTADLSILSPGRECDGTSPSKELYYSTFLIKSLYS